MLLFVVHRRRLYRWVVSDLVSLSDGVGARLPGLKLATNVVKPLEGGRLLLRHGSEDSGP